MFGRILGALGAFVLVAGIYVSPAQAVPVLFCSNGGIDLVADGCISGESKFYPGGGDGFYSNAGGGDPEAKVEQAILQATGAAADISLYGKTDDNPGLFSLTGFGGKSGTWSVIDNTLIRYITVKAANSYALYDVGNVSAGNWTTAGMFTKNKDNQPGVSHISFWTVENMAPVPLPAAAGLLLMGLGGLCAFGRRKP